MAPSFAFFFSFAATLAIVFAVKRLAERAQVLDVPNERSSHKVPVPRVGGVGVVAGVGLTLLLAPGSFQELRWALGGGLVLALIGLFDDLRGLRPAVRFLGQLLVCCGFVFIQPLPDALQIVSLSIHLGGWAAAAHVLWLMWMLNLFNFMDGIDGLAGSQIASAAVLFLLSTTGAISSFSLILLGSTCGFLFWNWPRAKVFMGDAGSTSIGFLIGALTLLAAPQLAITASVLVLLPFIFDATFTLIRRVCERRKVWEAHRSHIYQLPQAWGAKNTTVLYIELAVLAFQLCIALIHERNDALWVRWISFILPLVAATTIAFSVWHYAKKNARNVQW